MDKATVLVTSKYVALTSKYRALTSKYNVHTANMATISWVFSSAKGGITTHFRYVYAPTFSSVFDLYCHAGLLHGCVFR